MQIRSVLLIAKHTWKNIFRQANIYPVLLVFGTLVGFASFNAYTTYRVQDGIRREYQQMARNSWDKNPDKHPHRMAHFGTFAFRVKHPLSMFDLGTESFTGNAVFLEAHRQNSVNFSEAGFSTGLLRFGEISLAMLLQIIFPLIIFFIGFACIASERESGTLKVLLSQGIGWKELVIGKSLGLMAVSMLFLVPVFITTGLLLFNTNADNADVWIRFIILVFTYLLFCQILCIITVSISALSKTAKGALISLLGIWLVFVILIPKSAQAMGSYLHPSPSKPAFEAAIENDIIKEGDSHNPDDPHYKAIKDSVLKAYHADSVQQLPFNYSGFIMREGERLSAEIYNRHRHRLENVYLLQNSFSRAIALISPFAAQKHISMAFAGTDFHSYLSFQKQAEAYRYTLAQRMNQLQINLISNRKQGDNEKPFNISRQYWKEFPDFRYQFLSTGSIVQHESLSLISLVIWCILSFMLMHFVSKKAKAV